MPNRPRGNVPQNGLRWTIEKASIEFGAPANTIRKSLGSVHIACGADRCFTTQQICEALYGDMHKEKLRTQRQITERYSLENAITQGQVVPRSELMKVMTMIADAITSRIASSKLSREAQDDIMKDIASIPFVLKEVGQAQSRLPRRNGVHPEEVANET
jgi:hypothetical protein